MTTASKYRRKVRHAAFTKLCRILPGRFPLQFQPTPGHIKAMATQIAMNHSSLERKQAA